MSADESEKAPHVLGPAATRMIAGMWLLAHIARSHPEHREFIMNFLAAFQVSLDDQYLETLHEIPAEAPRERAEMAEALRHIAKRRGGSGDMQ